MEIHREGRIEDLNLFRMEDLTLFDVGKVATATNNFHSENKLGQGGFGPVYKVIWIYQTSSLHSKSQAFQFINFAIWFLGKVWRWTGHSS